MNRSKGQTSNLFVADESFAPSTPKEHPHRLHDNESAHGSTRASGPVEGKDFSRSDHHAKNGGRK